MNRSILISIILLCTFTACKKYATESSEVLTEQGVVLALSYMPKNHGSGLGPAFSLSDGSMSLAVTSVSMPEKYAVVFRCSHGSFVVESGAKELFSNLQTGQEVTIEYRERYRIVTENGQILSKNITGYDFITAY